MNTNMKAGKMKAGVGIVAATIAVMGLSACVSDGGSYSSFSMGVSSYDRGYDGPYRGGYGYRGTRANADYDRDGVPNWADRYPRNPWRD